MKKLSLISASVGSSHLISFTCRQKNLFLFLFFGKEKDKATGNITFELLKWYTSYRSESSCSLYFQKFSIFLDFVNF